MPTGVKVALYIGAGAVVCYALNINPFNLLAELIHQIQQLHQQTAAGG